MLDKATRVASIAAADAAREAQGAAHISLGVQAGRCVSRWFGVDFGQKP